MEGWKKSNASRAEFARDNGISYLKLNNLLIRDLTREEIAAIDARRDAPKRNDLPREIDLNQFSGARSPTTGILYDLDGYPIFDDVTIFDTTLDADIAVQRSRHIHFREATQDLKRAIDEGEISPDFFNEEQLAAIEAGAQKIPGLTWHHHQDTGRLQLVPEEIHRGTFHGGGFTSWFGDGAESSFLE